MLSLAARYLPLSPSRAATPQYAADLATVVATALKTCELVSVRTHVVRRHRVS